ncbi:MAG: hypothetical protein K0R72_28 [Clostridia bacterium]|nr:hypothetical protein [Clostridia bacterium]
MWNFSIWWEEMDSNHCKRKLTDLQSASFNHSDIFPYIKKWWAFRDSNSGPTGYEPVALTN